MACLKLSFDGFAELEEIELAPTENAHVVASIFKLFLRELPEPLCSFGNADAPILLV